MHVNVKVDITQKDQYENNIRHIVKNLVEDWRDTPEDAIRIREVSGGITNNLFRASVENNPTANVLIRIYGNKTELIIDRKKELEVVRHLYKTGYGPKVYGSFSNGYVYEYYEGRSLSGDELKSGRWNSQIGHVLAKWHKISTSNDSGIWKTITQWIDLVPEKYEDPKKDVHFDKIGGKETVKREFDLLKQVADELNPPVVFSHNDLLGGNVIVNEETEEVKFIDFEYADANYQAFDIANHFNEWAGFEADYSRYPNKEEQYQFYESYLKEFHGREPTPEELHTLYVQVNKFALLSHYYWGTWALVQGGISQLDFDFVEYSGLRFAEYFARKEEFLSLK